MASSSLLEIRSNEREDLEDFAIDAVTLSAIVQGANSSLLQARGGVHGIAEALRVLPERGVADENDLRRRVAAFGSNSYIELPPRGLLSFVFSAMQDATLAVLAACAIISLGVGMATEGFSNGWCDGAGIILSILLVVAVTASSDYQQYLQFRDLDKEKGKIFAQVTRGGSRRRILVHELVVGDVVHIGVGDRIPGDGLLLASQSLVVDESCMTGESEPKRKSSGELPFLISGTKIMDGFGTMIITGVGMNTEWGHAMTILSGGGGGGDGNDGGAEAGGGGVATTPLQAKLASLATLIGKVGMVFAAMTFVVLMAKMIVSRATTSSWSSRDAMRVLRFFATAVTIVVVAVPEGLPLAVTLSLAFAMKQMMRDKALVRHLAACETMGSATCICSDKTGTLTTNKMTVVKVCAGDADAMGFDDGGEDLWVAPSLRGLLLEGVFVNTSGDVVGEEVFGSPTEAALLQFGLRLSHEFSGLGFSGVRRESRVVSVQPFSSSRKKMGVVIEKGESFRIHLKGAPEIVLAMCDRYFEGSRGLAVGIDDNKRWKLRGVIRGLADRGLRTLCLAYKDLGEGLEEREAAERIGEESGFVFLAIVGIKDPVRRGVGDAVKLCRSAGIRVRMVTGDNLYTAMAIARECGILTDGDAVEGPEFRSWSSEETRRRIPKLQVLARTSPSDKHRLVKELQAMGEVVAVTGDGTNDAPALYEADIGLAMGISGTEVAKESADIIILDDNFASIVNVAKWGRSVYTNIQKFVQFQSTVNLVALLLNFLSACSTGEVPLTIVQLLWVNLIMDTLGALALATDPPHDGLMKQRPVGRKDHFVSGIMCRNVVAQATYQLCVLVLLQYKGKQLFQLQASGAHGTKVLNSMIFNTFVFFQVFNEFNSREMEKLNVFRLWNKNWIFVAIVSTTVCFQVIIVEFLGKLAKTTPLSAKQWMFSVGIASISILVDVGVKLAHLLLKRCCSKPKSFYKSGFLRAASCPLIPKSNAPVGSPHSATLFLKAKSYHAIPREQV